ncbi:hypothetical protein ACIQPQ_34580 [Streptomyces sp. NPDC091281]|uniref:hypothetical protein n=1 Tax=Streptomyces sp. NPDC091281 TaxID=3365985 RepID=UPI0038018FA3
MPDQLFPEADRASFDLDAVQSTITSAAVALLQFSTRPTGNPPDKAQAAALMESMRNSLLAGMRACNEVTRLRQELGIFRDQHRPQPHADPTMPGALCAACSVHGTLVAWPCGLWTAAERLLNHGKA